MYYDYIMMNSLSQVEVSNKNGTKRTTLMPGRTEVVKSLSRSYQSAATNFLSGAQHRRHLINVLAKHILIK